VFSSDANWQMRRYRAAGIEKVHDRCNIESNPSIMLTGIESKTESVCFGISTVLRRDPL
jgi:hypothetical protein